MDFLVLGPLRVAVDGRLIEISAAKPRSLLGVLLVNANQVVSADRLLEEVWGDRQPSGGVKTLRYHLSKLRDVLEPERGRGEEGCIGTVAGGYVLRAESRQLDARRFEHLASGGAELLSKDSPDLAHERLEEALGLWRGGPFEDFRYDSFAQGEIARLEELRLVCVENRIAADLELGRHRELVGELRDVTTRLPLRERFWGQLMTALYRSDQQAEALRAYQTARTVLGEELGIEPNTALQRLEEQILLHELPFEPTAAESGPSDNLPVRTSSFIGRQDDIAELEELLGERRLVTLAGFAGIGKTSLAIEVVRQMVDSYRDGVWLIELAPLTDPSGVVGVMGTIFDVRAHPSQPLLDALVQQLSSKSLLLVIDNCEHLLAESARVIEALLAGCPELRVLATSREPLQLPGEQISPVAPLDLPAGEEVTVELAGRIEAVQLFVDRARQSQPGFDLNDTNFRDVVAVVRRLEGIPLAIELAAARLRVLSPYDLLDRLDDQLGVLTAGGAGRPERHRTLRAAIDWSYHLLPERGQILLRRLAVFRGGFTLRTTEDICNGNGVAKGEILDGIGDLVDASLLTTQHEERHRYGMLESVRQYAEALLAASGEETELRDRHADYFAGLGPTVSRPTDADFDQNLEALAVEEDNYASALAWAIHAGNGKQALALAARIGRYWAFQGKADLHESWFLQVLDIADSAPSLERVVLLFHIGANLSRTGRGQQALPIIDELLAAAKHLDDPTAWALLTNLQMLHNTHESDLRHELRWALEHYPGNTGAPRSPMHFVGLAEVAMHAGRYDIAADALEETETLATNTLVSVITAQARGALAFCQGDLTTARRLLAEALGEMRWRNLVEFLPLSLVNLAQVALATGNATEAEDWAQQLIDAAQRSLRSRELAAGHTIIARALRKQQRLEAACSATAEALDIVADTNDKLAMTWVLATVGEIAWAGGNAINAATVHAGAETLRTQIGFVHPAPRARELEHEYRRIQDTLGADAFNTAWKTGTTLTIDELAHRARQVLNSVATTDATTLAPQPVQAT